jgi:hypothetical protein
MNIKYCVISISFLFYTISIFAQDSVRYVDQSVSSSGDGLSWATAYKSFEDFDINNINQIPASTIIYVAPGYYAISDTGRAYEPQAGKKALIWIKNDREITIIQGIPPYPTNEPVIFSGIDGQDNILSYGIFVGNNNSFPNINFKVEGIHFESFYTNSIKKSGGEPQLLLAVLQFPIVILQIL